MAQVPQRDPRREYPTFLAFVRRKPCCVCFAPAPSEAAHIRMAAPEIGKRGTGMQEKPHDKFACPLCASCHRDGPNAQHRQNEGQFWKGVGVDPFDVAAELWAEFVRDHGEPAPVERKPKKGRKPSRSKTTRKILENSRASIPAAKLRTAKRKWATGQKIPSRPFNRSRP